MLDLPTAHSRAPGHLQVLLGTPDGLEIDHAHPRTCSTALSPSTAGGRIGGKQIQIEDPDGNPIENHEPPR